MGDSNWKNWLVGMSGKKSLEDLAVQDLPKIPMFLLNVQSLKAPHRGRQLVDVLSLRGISPLLLFFG